MIGESTYRQRHPIVTAAFEFVLLATLLVLIIMWGSIWQGIFQPTM